MTTCLFGTSHMSKWEMTINWCLKFLFKGKYINTEIRFIKTVFISGLLKLFNLGLLKPKRVQFRLIKAKNVLKLRFIKTSIISALFKLFNLGLVKPKRDQIKVY